MAFTKTTEAKKNFDVVITKANVVKNGLVKFNCIVNGVFINEAWCKEIARKDGGVFHKIDFPSRPMTDKNGNTIKDEDGYTKYYSYVLVPFDKVYTERVASMIEEYLNRPVEA